MFEGFSDFVGGFFEGTVKTKSLGLGRANAVVGAIPFLGRIKDLSGAPYDFDIGFDNWRSGIGVVRLGEEAGSRYSCQGIKDDTDLHEE